MIALKGVSLTHTFTRAFDVTKVLVVVLRTLFPAVTNVCRVKTDSGPTAAVEAKTDGRFTLMFIFVVRTVQHSVTVHIYWQTISVA